MCVLLMLFAVLFSPLSNSELAMPAEARATLGALKDRLRIMYRANQNRVDPTWRVTDVLTEHELAGSYFTAADYSMHFDVERPSWVRLRCAGGGYYKGPMILEADLDTGMSEFTFPGPVESERAAERQVGYKVLTALVAGPVLLLPILFRRKLRVDLRASLWLIGAGMSSLAAHAFAAVFLDWYVTEHTPEPTASIATLGLIVAACVSILGFGMFLVAMVFPADLIKSK